MRGFLQAEFNEVRPQITQSNAMTSCLLFLWTAPVILLFETSAIDLPSVKCAAATSGDKITAQRPQSMQSETRELHRTIPDPPAWTIPYGKEFWRHSEYPPDPLGQGTSSTHLLPTGVS